MSVLLLLAHSHGERALEILAQHIAKFDDATIQDIFQIGPLTQNYGSEAGATQLLAIFADRNCSFTTRNLCFRGNTMLCGPLLCAAEGAVQYDAAAAMPTKHHRDCPYKDTQTSVMYHWVHLPSSDPQQLLDWLEVACTVGVDLSTPPQEGGMTLLHDVLRQININSSSPECWTTRQKFIVLAKEGLHPTKESSCEDLLNFLKAQLIEAEARYEESLGPNEVPRWNRDRQQGRRKYARELLSQVIKAVEYYLAHHKHWPDLEATLPVPRWNYGQP